MRAIEHLEHVVGLVERTYATKPARYIVGAIEFLCAWCFAAVIVGLLVKHFFPPQHGETPIFLFGWDWRNLPGALLGVFAGSQRFLASVRGPKEKDGFSSGPRPFNYQAADGIHSLQKRVVRNRFIAMSVLLFLILSGALFFCLRH